MQARYVISSCLCKGTPETGAGAGHVQRPRGTFFAGPGRKGKGRGLFPGSGWRPVVVPGARTWHQLLLLQKPGLPPSRPLACLLLIPHVREAQLPRCCWQPPGEGVQGEKSQEEDGTLWTRWFTQTPSPSSASSEQDSGLGAPEFLPPWGKAELGFLSQNEPALPQPPFRNPTLVRAPEPPNVGRPGAAESLCVPAGRAGQSVGDGRAGGVAEGTAGILGGRDLEEVEGASLRRGWGSSY